MRVARILICAADSSPETESVLSPFAARAIWSERVDFPIPGSPPSSTSDPGTMPPPSTRFTSVLPRSSRRCSLSRMSATRWGRLSGSGPPTAAGTWLLPREMISSVKVFHSPQPGHLPSHFGASNPQLRQK